MNKKSNTPNTIDSGMTWQIALSVYCTFLFSLPFTRHNCIFLLPQCGPLFNTWTDKIGRTLCRQGIHFSPVNCINFLGQLAQENKGQQLSNSFSIFALSLFFSFLHLTGQPSETFKSNCATQLICLAIGSANFITNQFTRQTSSRTQLQQPNCVSIGSN